MPETIVVGGGVIGLMTARALHQSGHKVLLIERGSLGGESSWAGGGIISPLYPWRYSEAVNVLAQRSKAVYAELAETLKDESGIDCELQTSGLLITDTDELEQSLLWAKQYAEKLELVSGGQALRKIEPALSKSIDEALWLPNIRQIRNPKLLKALRLSFERLSIPFREHTTVDELRIDDGRIIAVRTEDGDITADNVVIAGGAWSAGLIEDIHAVKVEPVKGQMVMFKGDVGKVKRIVMSTGHYIIPRSDGHVLAGSTLEKTGFDKSVSDEALLKLREDAVSLIPELANMPIERQWAGLRPGTTNGVPYVCPIETVKGLYLNAGHYRNGIVLGPASVQLLVEQITGQQPFCDVSPFALTATH